ncbi:MAG: hypothetical protein GC162_02580 [Planctomycetes bacterium]|nr:hypothetical protein [Planctomycetota bacterium]
MTPTTSDFWQQVFSSPLFITCGLVASLLLIAALLLVRAMVRMRRVRVSITSVASDAGGTATIEFALVLPILLFVVLTLAQTTLLMGGVVFVNYAAFAAARSAIVQIPYDYPGEPANFYTNSPSSPKYQAIHRSAAVALMPVASGAPSYVDSTTLDTAGFVDGLNQFYGAYGQNPPNWIANLAADRLAYADGATEITLSRPYLVDDQTVDYEEIDGMKVDAKDPIRVRVDHRLNLSIPWANRVYRDGEQSDGIAQYKLISATATLTNEGILDKMPPQPSVPRVP